MKFLIKFGFAAILCTFSLIFVQSNEAVAAKEDKYANYMMLRDYASVNKY
jgi:hypothetical protein